MKEKKEEFRSGDLVQIERHAYAGLPTRGAKEERARVGLLLERVMVGLIDDPRHIPEPAWHLILTTPTRPNRICWVYEYRLKLISRSDP